MAKSEVQAALPRSASHPSRTGQAHLALALAAVGDPTAAIPHLQKAATASDPTIRQEAAQALRKLGKQP